MCAYLAGATRTTSALEHPTAGTLIVVAFRATTDSPSINITFGIGVALSVTPIAEHPEPDLHAFQRMRGPAITEHALHRLAGENSTASRMTKANRFGAHDNESCNDREAQSPGFRCRRTRPHRRH